MLRYYPCSKFKANFYKEFIISLFLSFSIFINFNSYSQNAPITTVSSATGCPGDTIILYVSAINCIYISGVNFELDYDAAVISFINQNPNNLPGNHNNTNSTLYLCGGDFQILQTNSSAGYKKVHPLWWSANCLPSSNNNLANLFDLKFRYYGGSTTISFNNSIGYGQACEWEDTIGNPLIDTPTVNFYNNGTVSQAPVPTQPGVINGYVQPVIGDTTIYYVSNVHGITYTWSAPSAWYGTSNSSSISYIVGTGTGTITITPTNCTGTGPPKTFNVVPMTGNTIKGHLTYDNNTCTPLDSAWIFLKQNGLIIDSVQTDLAGFYQFNVGSNGAYNLASKTQKPFGGVNSTDAVKVKRHFAGSELLTSSIRLHAADVNLSFSVNTTDAVNITSRFVGSDTSFEKGDWVFEKPHGGDTLNVSHYLNDSVIINGNNIYQNFKGLCVGDVNGSNYPSQGAKSSSFPKVQLEFHDDIRLSTNKFFELPVFVTSDVNISALSLIFYFPGALLQIEGIQLASGTEQSELFYKITGNEIRIGWTESFNPLILSKGDTLFTIKLKTTEKFNSGDIINIKVKNDPLCEFANENAEPLENVTLSTYSLKYSNDNQTTKLTLDNDFIIFPNPSKDKFNIKFNIFFGTANFKIFNTLGEELISENINLNTLRNNYQLEISNLPEGFYFIKYSNGKNFIIKKIVVSK